MTQILRITSRRAGFRRCGVAHPAEATDHARGRWSAEEIEQLKAEPMLIVEEVEVAAGKSAKAPDSGGKRSEPTREDTIRTAMRNLDRETQPDRFTGSGKPKTEALQELTGLETVTARERDTLWAEIEAATS